jgi:hypothetical protein
MRLPEMLLESKVLDRIEFSTSMPHDELSLRFEPKAALLRSFDEVSKGLGDA